MSKTKSGTLHAFGAIFEYEYTDGHPGQPYGPPENCYPPEPPEIEITHIDIENVDRFLAFIGVSHVEDITLRIEAEEIANSRPDLDGGPHGC